MFKSDQVTVGGTAVELTANFNTDQDFELTLRFEGPGQLWIGDSTLDPAVNGYPLRDETAVMRLKGNKVYGIVTSGGPSTVFLLSAHVTPE